MINIVFWLIFGALVGWLASILTGNREQSLLLDIVVGIIGSAIGGALFAALGGEGVTGFNIYSIVVGVVGAVVLLMLLNMVKGRTPAAR